MNRLISPTPRPPEFRHSRATACGSVLGMLCLLVACEGEEPIPASLFVPTEAPKECPGAYSPNSDICWRENDGGEEGQIQQNSASAQEKQSDVSGTERCAGGIIGAPGTPGMLTVSFTTQRLGGMYAPRNCGAVWVEDSLGFYVRTLDVWAHDRQQSVVAWFSSACHSDQLVVDATSSATLEQHGPHTATWDMKSFRGAVVPDGVYTVWMQVTENEIVPEGPFIEIEFTKGPTPLTLPAPPPNGISLDQPGFEDVKLVYTPNGAAPPPTTTP